VDRLDLRSGQLQSVDPTLAFPGNYRGTWTLPLVFGKEDHALYFGNQRIFRTADGGRHGSRSAPISHGPFPGMPANLDAAAAADEEHIGPPARRRLHDRNIAARCAPDLGGHR